MANVKVTVPLIVNLTAKDRSCGYDEWTGIRYQRYLSVREGRSLLSGYGKVSPTVNWYYMWESLNFSLLAPILTINIPAYSQWQNPSTPLLVLKIFVPGLLELGVYAFSRCLECPSFTGLPTKYPIDDSCL